MASLHTISPHGLLPLAKSKKPTSKIIPHSQFFSSKSCNTIIFSTKKQSSQTLRFSCQSAVQEELDFIPLKSEDTTDHQEGVAVMSQMEIEGTELSTQVGGFGSSEAQLSFEGFSSASSSGFEDDGEARQRELEMDMSIDRSINAMIVLAAGSYAITKLLTIDHDYWHGWTLFEIVRYAPQHNWSAYEEALKTNPVLAKMMISGVVYSVGDWIAQCYEGKPIFDFDRTRMFRSGLVGFTLHGSLSHYYYQFCEELFPFQDWWVVPVKVAFDQTAWAALWNSIYFIALGFLRFESPFTIFSELKATFLPMLTAGWKLWPFAHLITYGVIPVEQRLLWVDCVELIWVTILSTYSNEKSEARISEAAEASSNSLADGLDELQQ
ncbi:Peroxisomal membrane 22 kDa (Mpv17/PMP22) family protein [Euphorbia peplus]|nr:Peroxisomal membrane 22 kDa (Mpv17/PMP22) family protein [Euphorbia peplus]